MFDLQAFEAVPGWFNAAEGLWLYEQVKALGARAKLLVEIGSFRGRSTVAILQGCRDAEMAPTVLVCVDNFSGDGREPGTTDYERRKDGEAQLLENIKRAGLKRWLLSIHSTSSQEWFKDHPLEIYRGAYDFFFVDGEHARAAEDAAAAWERLRPGGVLVCHDYDPATPESAVVKALNASGLPGAHCGMPGTALWKAVRE